MHRQQAGVASALRWDLIGAIHIFSNATVRSQGMGVPAEYGHGTAWAIVGRTGSCAILFSDAMHDPAYQGAGYSVAWRVVCGLLPRSGLLSLLAPSPGLPVASVVARACQHSLISRRPLLFFSRFSILSVGFLSFSFFLCFPTNIAPVDIPIDSDTVHFFRSRRPTGRSIANPPAFSLGLTIRACAGARMSALQNLPQSWRRLVFLLPVLVITLILATGLYNGSLPKPRL